MSHEWQKLNLTSLSVCFSCHKAIWYPFSSGVSCVTCSLKAHKACAKKTTVRCTKVAPQSFMAVGVARIRVIAGVNFDMDSDSFVTLQLDQQTATTRIAFGGSHFWNQTFTFVVTSSSKRKFIIEGYEHEYMDNTFLGTSIVPRISEYTEEEEIFVDLHRGGVKTKMALRLAISYKPLYNHPVEWHFDTSSSTTSVSTVGKSNPQTPLNRRLKRRHSVQFASSTASAPSNLHEDESFMMARTTTDAVFAKSSTNDAFSISSIPLGSPPSNAKHHAGKDAFKSSSARNDPSNLSPRAGTAPSSNQKQNSQSLTQLPPHRDTSTMEEQESPSSKNTSVPLSFSSSSTGAKDGVNSGRTFSDSRGTSSSQLVSSASMNAVSSSSKSIPSRSEGSEDQNSKSGKSKRSSSWKDEKSQDNDSSGYEREDESNGDAENAEDEDEETEEGFVVFRDHFGFPIESSHIEAYLSMFEFQFSTRMKEQATYLATHLNKLLSTNVTRPIISREMVGFAKSGFPLSHRGDLWQAMSGSKDAMRRHRGLYRSLLERNEGVETASTTQIEKDLHRTFISNPFLRTKSDLARLQRVLNAFSFYDPQTGYCQSLNFIAALFLLLMSEEEAFWLLVVTTKRYLPEYYTPEMVGSKTDAHIFEALLYTYFPLIAHQLFDLGLPVVLRTASWFLCMFVTILPIETTMRVFDWMFAEGSQIIFSIGLALFHLSANDLATSNSFDSAYFTFTTMTQHCYNADHLIELAATKYYLVRKEIALLRNRLRLEYSRRDEQELISSLNLSPDDFYTLVTQIEHIASTTRNASGSATANAKSRNAKSKSNVPRSRTNPASLPENHDSPIAEVESGVLSKSEFVAVFKKIFPNLEKSVPESVFDTLDSDEDSGLTIKECLLGISAFVVGAPEKKAMMWFRVFDKNNDGILDVSEIKDLLLLVWKLIDKQLDNSWIADFLKVVETTHAGRITKFEFVSACLDMPVLSEWLKFGFTLGDRMKIIAAKQEAAHKVDEMRLSGNFSATAAAAAVLASSSSNSAQVSNSNNAGLNSANAKDSEQDKRFSSATIAMPSPARRRSQYMEDDGLRPQRMRARGSEAMAGSDSDEDSDFDAPALSSSPPHTWLDQEGRLRPGIVENVLHAPPSIQRSTGDSEQLDLGPDASSLPSVETDLTGSGFILM